MANPSLSVRVFPEVLRTLAFGSISGAYAGIGTPLLNPARVMYIVNETDVLLTFSFNGLDDHFVVVSHGYFVLDVTANKSENGGAFCIAQNERLYVKGAPTLGAVYATFFYGAGTI